VPKPYSSAPSSAATMTSRPVLKAAVRAHLDARPEVVREEDLLRFRQPEFPGGAGGLDRSLHRSARTAGIARDEHRVAARLRDNSRRDGADVCHRDEFDVDSAAGLAHFKSWINCARSSME